MIKRWAKETEKGTELGGSRQYEGKPDDSIWISEENYNYAVKLNQIDLIIDNGTVRERTPEEKETIRTAILFPQEKAEVSYKLGRRSYRQTRLPFEYNGKEIKLEQGNLRATPRGIFSTWEHLIRDAYNLEKGGDSILPITLMNTDGTTTTITTPEQLKELYLAMVQRNKLILEQEKDLRLELEQATTYSELKTVRQANHLLGVDD
jgi:hypothetical protein